MQSENKNNKIKDLKDELLQTRQELEKCKQEAIDVRDSLKREVAVRKRVDQAILYRVKFERLISNISTHFINFPTSSIDEGINQALKSISEFSGADRSYVVQFTENNQHNMVYEWRAEGIKSKMEKLKELSADTFPWGMKKLRNFENICISSVNDLPPEAQAEKESFKHLNVCSLIIAPMMYGKNLIGFLGFDSVKEEKTWHDDMIMLLKSIGQIFANAFAHKISEEKIKILAKFTDEHINPVLRIGFDKKILYANHAAMPLLEIWNCEVGAAMQDEWFNSLSVCLNSGFCRDIEVEIGDKTFTFLTVPISETDSTYLYAQDITERKQYEEQLLLLASVFKNTIEGIAITDSDGIIERINPSFSIITGYKALDVLGKAFHIFKKDLGEADFYKEIKKSLLKKGHWKGEVWNRRKNGEAYPEWLSVTEIKDFNEKINHYVSVFHDITNIKRSEEQLKYQAYHDALTGLPNRQLFNDRLERAIAYAYRNNQSVGVLFLDLDNFKHINDSLGHNIGDIFLREVAERLKECCREEDTVARLGGDEFIMILPDVKGRHDGATVAQRIIQSFSEPILLQGHELFPSASIGITIYPSDGNDVSTLVKNADMAMYKVKDQGRNNYAMYTKDMNATSIRRITLESSLRKALGRNEFRLHYQPKVNIKTGEITGTEALVRWQPSENKIVSPYEFIPIAEETGVIFPLGEWVLRTACSQTKKWHDIGYLNISVAVNLSARQFQDNKLLSIVKSSLKESGLDPKYLNLELTENIVMINIDTAVKTLEELASMGISISIDDFGTGYSSLSYLKRFPLNVLKIDRSFVKDIPADPDDMAIARAILSLAGSLNLKVVAEGVETKEQLDFMLSHGCDEIQGYIFSKPLPSEELLLLLKQRKRLKID